MNEVFAHVDRAAVVISQMFSIAVVKKYERLCVARGFELHLVHITPGAGHQHEKYTAMPGHTWCSMHRTPHANTWTIRNHFGGAVPWTAGLPIAK